MSRIIFLLEERSMNLGEPSAVAEAFGNEQLRNLGAKARYRDPDAVVRPSIEIEKLVPEFQKVSGARRMAERLSRNGNSSRSFQVLINGIEREAAALGMAPVPGGEA